MGLKEVKQEMLIEALAFYIYISASNFESPKFKSCLGAPTMPAEVLSISAFHGGKNLDVTPIGKKLLLSNHFQFYHLPVNFSLYSSANVSN